MIMTPNQFSADIHARPQEAGENLQISYYCAIAMSLFPVAAALIAGKPAVPFLLIGFSLLALTLASRKVGGVVGPLIISLCLVGQTTAVTAAFAGHPWQLDTHMLYFVVLAIVATQFSLVSLFAATAFIALHHLSLSLLLPALLYPSTVLFENLMRTGLHAGIVLMETLVLSLSITKRNTLLAAQMQQEAALRKAQADAAAAHDKEMEAFARVAEVVDVLSAALKRLSKRDMTCDIDTAFSTDFDYLRGDFNNAVSSLREVLADASMTVLEFGGRSGELADAASGLEHRTRTQVTTLSQATATMQSLIASLDTMIAQAESATKMTRNASESAGQGKELMLDATQAMSRIEQSSGEISAIIEVIEDIAFQTNMLALNAAVEAARAGEAGKGFAVVAAEVRNLALGTASAAKDVKALIQNSHQHVSDGARLVNATGAAFKEIVDNTTRAVSLVTTIDSTIQEQASSLTEVTQIVTNLDKSNQENAAMVGEMSSLGLAISGGSERLGSSFSSFKLVLPVESPGKRSVHRI